MHKVFMLDKKCIFAKKFDMNKSTKIECVKVVGMIILIIATCFVLAMLSSCKPVKEIVYKDVYHTDTLIVKKEVHDTTKTVETKFDSVYKFVKDSSWMDSIGHYYHNRETYYYHIYNETTEQYKVLERENDSLRSVIDNSVDSTSHNTIEYRDNIIYRTNPWHIVTIIVLVLAIMGYFVCKYWDKIKPTLSLIIDKVKQFIKRLLNIK